VEGGRGVMGYRTYHPSIIFQCYYRGRVRI
jgi:hypothetical protein